ncbi:hypothetical protein Fcan01_16332 [Folsomia candida]|uniref:Uncharacterized protein n=1 Tax=Folsomia candida TaxID=158441 RepID=A0A226DW80_FOLCA|nr:hypothetical protein Fcan01_16332 [Folsomia candida]
MHFTTRRCLSLRHVFYLYTFLLFICALIFLSTSLANQDGWNLFSLFQGYELTQAEIESGTGQLAQDDARLMRHISEKYLIPPSPKGVQAGVDWTPVHLTNKFEQQEVSRFIIDLFKNKNGGTFIECGANDGEFFSNTMLLEEKWNFSVTIGTKG